MKRVTGIGGVFFKARDPKALSEWYQHHLGIALAPWGGAVFRWKSEDNPDGLGATAWNIFPQDSGHFDGELMLNYRVHDLHALLAALRAEGCSVEDKVDESEFGKFGWVRDPEGRRVELWEPPAGR